MHARMWAVALLCSAAASQAQTTEGATPVLREMKVIDSAEDVAKQALGVSTITAEDLERAPPANDISEIVRTMPGVNLTGNSSSGQRGNNRQIDLRGMGPENTLILIDGKPASSRNAVRMGWRGERDSRGDSNWVPAEQIESIEVMRGPAAARYGSGAMGGVVNIVTKKPTDKISGQVSVYADAHQHGEEGSTRRGNFSLSGPVSEEFSLRINGNANNTAADGRYINAGHQAAAWATSMPAGREGVNNRDLTGLLSWKFMTGHTLDLDVGYNRQGNIYAGDSQNNTGGSQAAIAESMYGKETNVMERHTLALTHKGKYDFGTSTSYIQRIVTDNTRLGEGLVGAQEGLINTRGYTTNQLVDNLVHTEWEMPHKIGGLNQVLTVGAEFSRQSLYDPTATTVTQASNIGRTGRRTDTEASIASVFAEDNMEVTDKTFVTPSLRLDSHSETGANWSPAVSVSHYYSDTITFKGGIARAYKAPNLYQTNSDYVLYSAGNGCVTAVGTACYLVGNADLQAETSINKELGVEYKNEGVVASITWFHNDYRNKIQAGTTSVSSTAAVYEWVNVPEAVSQGIEGSYRMPLGKTIEWSNNFTYMLEHRNKTNDDYLSIIPEYTINTSLEWRGVPKWVMTGTITFYGVQHAMKYDYNGNLVSGTSAESVAPYNIVSLSGKYTVKKDLHMTVGLKNVFDIRHWRSGNAVGVRNLGTNSTTNLGAGANTYNESGRTLYASATYTF
ncbi:FepA family TonB-dependent siderophore receptor [Curvibacter sp. CHRR-16]|nr:FepA family TonB-dependent siderophore receptor [Curvibacter sp. CHRR-16]